jgi:hypothetical protein
MREWACATFAAGLLVARTAHADGDARLAQALFDEARYLMEQKRYAEACPKLKESQRLDPGGGTLLNLASCHELEGKTASALDEYHEALDFALRDRRDDREKIARTHIDKLEREVPRITVKPVKFVEGLEVKLDSTTLAPAAWGVATPVDPGRHVITATAVRHQTLTITVDIRPSERREISLPEPKTDEQAIKEGPAAPTTTSNPVFYVGLYTGLGALAVSAVTGVLTITNTVKAKADCSEKRTFCKDADALDSLHDARTYGWVSTISLGLSVAGFIVAIIAPSKKHVVQTTGSGVSFRF